MKVTLDKTPPELAADIMEQGIVLAGGGALLNGLDARLEHETGMPIVIAAQPAATAVAIGSGQSLEEFEALKGVLFSASASAEARDRWWPSRGARGAAGSRSPCSILTSITLITLDFRGWASIDSARNT